MGTLNERLVPAFSEGRPEPRATVARLAAWLLLPLLLALSVPAFAISYIGAGSPAARAYVQKAYVAYYGRPADPEGQGFWATQMDAAGGSLAAIIASFGNSAEFTSRYGGLTPEELITRIYQQALNRNPDPAGLAYYVSELQSGNRTLQAITLDVLNGATTPPDSTTIENKLAVADYYTAAVTLGCPYGTEQTGVAALAPVASDPATVAAAMAANDVRCGGIGVVAPMKMEPSFPLNVLDFELPSLIGKNVWVMGFYGSPRLGGDGLGFLVDNPLRLMVDEVFPRHTFARLDGNLPPDDWEGAEVLVYGTVKDYGATYGAQAVHPTPLITVLQYKMMRPAAPTTSWENTFLLEPAPAPPRPRYYLPPGPQARFAPQAVPITGNTAQPCDRSIIISGGVDASNNHSRYIDNVRAKYNRMIEMGFTPAQIEVFYDDGAAIDVGGSNVVDQKATKQKIKDHIAALAASMPGSCTLTIFVTDHGTGYNAEQGYHGARPALSGEDANSGTLFAENTFKFDARAKVYQVSAAFVFAERSYFVSKPPGGKIRLYKRVGESWTFLGVDTDGNGIITETEASNEDFNNNGAANADYGLTVESLERLANVTQYRSNEWDTDGDGVKDVRLRHDGTRYVVERLVAGVWQEMGRDTNGDHMIDATDGGVDWNLDGDKNDQVGFHEGINLWGDEVLWDDEFAQMLEPLAANGVHILVEMVSCFSGGMVPQLAGLVEGIYAGASEDTKHWNRVDATGKVYAADEQAFLDNLKGIDPESWKAAGEAAKAADDAKATAEGSTKNQHTQWHVQKFVTQSVFRAEGNGEYTIELDIPDNLLGTVYDFEFIYGLQVPRWGLMGFPQGLPLILDTEAIPGGVRVYDVQPIADHTVVRIKVAGGPVTDAIRIEFTNAAHARLGYTIARPGTIPPLATVTLGTPLVCVDHFNPRYPNFPSTIEWLFPWQAIGPFDPKEILVTFRVTVPGQGPVTFVLPLLDFALRGQNFYAVLGISNTGQYPWEVVSMRHAYTGQELVVNGVTSGIVNVGFPGEQNPGQCQPPPLLPPP